MRLLITGDRTITEYRLLASLLDWSRLPDEAMHVVTGKNAGVDRLAQQWADERRLDVNLFSYQPYFKRHGRTKGAAHECHLDMAAVSDAGIVLWDRTDSTLWDLIQVMRSRGKPVDVGKVVNGKVQTELV